MSLRFAALAFVITMHYLIMADVSERDHLKSEFQQIENALQDCGFDIPDNLSAESNYVVLGVLGNTINILIPREEDALSELILVHYLQMLEEDFLSPHMTATLNLLREKLGMENQFKSAEDYVLTGIYRDLSELHPGFPGTLWKEDHVNGRGHSLEAINSVLSNLGEETIETLFHREAIRSIENWFPFVNLPEPINPPEHVDSIRLPIPSPLMIGWYSLAMEAEGPEGLVFELLSNSSSFAVDALCLYASPLNGFDLRPINEQIKIPLTGLESLYVMTFNLSASSPQEPPECLLTPIFEYPARVQNLHVKNMSDHRIITFDTDLTRDTFAWVILKTLMTDGLPETMIAGILPGVDYMDESMNFSFMDVNEDNTVVTYDLYALTGEGLMAYMGAGEP